MPENSLPFSLSLCNPPPLLNPPEFDLSLLGAVKYQGGGELLS
jgi:hypothetical protein